MHTPLSNTSHTESSYHILACTTIFWARTTPQGQGPLLSRCTPPLGVQKLAVRGVEPLRMRWLHILGVEPFQCCRNGRNTTGAGAHAHAWDVGDIDSLYNRNGPKYSLSPEQSKHMPGCYENGKPGSRVHADFLTFTNTEQPISSPPCHGKPSACRSPRLHKWTVPMWSNGKPSA